MANIIPIAGLILIVVIFLAVLSIGKYQQPKYVPVKVGNVTLNAEVADTSVKQVRGLMFRENLAKDDGMLFVFGSEGRHGIWMMNTSIPLDIIWLDRNKKVIYIKEDAQPCDALVFCNSYFPESDAKYVLEVNAEYVKKNGIKIGSFASW